MQSGREDTLEEWYAIKFCFKLRKNATETYGMLQTAFGLSCMNFMDKDGQVSIETVSAQFDVNVGTVHRIIRNELKMPVRIIAKIKKMYSMPPQHYKIRIKGKAE